MPALTAQQLFQPIPSGVGPFGNVPLVPDSGTWLGRMLLNAQTVRLPTTSWQPGAPERTILAVEAMCFGLSDINIATFAQAGFLQTAATGTVTYTTTDGTTVTIPVTPDPSNPSQNPTGDLGWLDLLTQSVYGVYRLSATYATGPLAIANLKGTSVGPYAAGAYHVSNVGTGASYHNPSSVTVPSSIIAAGGGVVTGVIPGLLFSIITTSAPHGLTPGEVVYIVIPVTSGITGLAGTSGQPGVFAIVTSVTPTTFAVNVSSSGTYTSGGNVYLATVATMAADAPGIASNAAPGSVTVAITQNAQVFIGNVVAWSGSNWESNLALMNRAQLSLALVSPNGPSQSYVFFAESAQQILSTGQLPRGGSWPVYSLTNGPVAANEFANPTTGVVTVVVGSATPASDVLGANVTPGVSQLLVTGVTSANPAVVTTAGANTLVPGQSMTVTITGVLGPTTVNGTFVGTYVSANSFSVPLDTTSQPAYVGGGSVEGGDLGQIDALIQANVVPDNSMAQTVSAVALPVLVVATVVVPQAMVATYRIAVLNQLATQIASYAIGGNAPTFAVSYDDIVGALEEAGVVALGQASYVRSVQSLSLNGLGVGAGVAFPGVTYQAVLLPPSVSVVGV